MPTCFLAVPLPLSVRESLAQIRPPRLPGVKFVHPDKMHVTLHYLGEITSEEVELVKTVLSDIEAPRFSLDLTGVGAFPDRGPLRVVWAGIADNSVLNDLHQELGLSLSAAISFQPETRGFKPHITLARVHRPATREQFADYRKHFEKFKLPDVPVDRLVLYESSFGDGGSEFKELATRELRNGPSHY